MPKPTNIFLIGPTGVGKTTVGQALASELGLAFYDTDCEIEKSAGVKIDWIFAKENELGFRIREEKVIAELTQLSNIVLATGAGAILSANNRKLLAVQGTVIYLQITLNEQYSRAQNNHNNRPLLKTADTKATLRQMQLVREPLYQQIADITIRTSLLNVEAIVKQIIELLPPSLICLRGDN